MYTAWVDSYLTPTGRQSSELEIKRSRFITTVGHVADKPAAQEFINTLRIEMPDANHHCWAMVAGHPEDIYQQDQSDDREPKGTAGKPMLNVLRHSGMGNCIVVVTRYFGGVKLGSGGLVRAYTQSVTEALKLVDTRRSYIRTEVVITLPYKAFDSFEYWIQSTNIVITDKQFQESIIVKLQVTASDKTALDKEIEKLNGEILQNNQEA